MKAARTVTLTPDDLRELSWLRGGVNGLIAYLRLLAVVLEGDKLKAAGMTDLAPLLTLADAVDDGSEVLDRLLEDRT